MRYDDTVKKYEAFVAKEAELRQRYLKTMETLQVTLPPAAGEVLPYRKPDDLFRTVRQLRQGAEALGDLGLQVIEAADATERFAISEKVKIRARRELRDIGEQWANDMIALLQAFVGDAIDLMHHLKRLSKIENNPNGYYTQQYRLIHRAYRESMHNLHGGKARGRSPRKARFRYR